MDYITPVKKEVVNQISQIASLVDFELHKEENWIRETIRQRWLLGKRPDGSLIGLYRSEDYANYKFNENNKAGFGNVDLTLTGALVRGIRISGFNDEYEIYSEDTKYEDIVEKYGYYNFNISEDEQKELFQRIYNKVATIMLQESYALL